MKERVNYQSEILQIGQLVEEMAKQNMFILFSNVCPPDLADFCIIHKNEQQIKALEVGKNISIGEDVYTIKSIGNTALSQWNELGHVTLKFENNEEPLPGTVNIKEPLKSIPKVGETISIF